MLPSNSSADSNYPSDHRDDNQSYDSYISKKVIVSSKIKKISQRAEDIWMVRALDSKFQLNTTRSPVIEKLEEKRQEKYNNVIKELEESFKSVVENGNNTLRLIAETYQRELETNQNSMAQIESLVEDCSTVPNLQRIQNAFLHCYFKFNKLKEKRKSIIEEFEEEAKLIMNKQLNDIKKIVANNLIKMNKISWLLQSQLQMQLEHRIWEIQKVVMSNYHNYADLKLHLLLIGEECWNNVRYKLEILYEACVTKAWRSSQGRVPSTQKVLSLMTEAHKQAYGVLNDMFTFLTKELTQLTGEFTFVKSLGDPVGSSSQGASTDKFSTPFKAFLTNIDECARQTILKYSSAIKELRTGYENDLINLENEYPEVSSPDKTNFLKVLGHPKMEAILKQYREAEKVVRGQWRTVADEIRISMIDTLNIFRDALEVKDRHLMRLDQAKDLLIELLNRIVDSKLDDEKTLEMKINIAMDTLRQGSTEEKLDNTYNEIVQMLDSMKETYEKNCIQEQEIFNEYNRIAQVEVDVFKDEIQAFLSKHPRNSIVDIYKIVPRRNGQDSVQTEFEDHAVTSKEMRMCYMHLTGVSNWTLGLWESVNTMKSTAVTSSQFEASLWIMEEKNVLGSSLNWKLQMHLARYKRIKSEIKDVRALEIRIHEERLRSHITAVENKLTELKGEITSMRSKQDEIIAEMKSKITDMISKLDECKESVFAKNLVNEISETQKETELRLKQLYDECKAIFEHKLKWLRQSNVSFLTSIKMFSEGGNYSSEEAKSVVAVIQNKSTLIDKEEGKMLDLLEQEIPDEFTSYSVDSESLKTVEKKLILTQQLERELPRLQSILRSATGAMKSEGKVLQEAIKKFVDESDEANMNELLDDILEKIEVRQNNLLFPPATKNLEFCYDDEEEPVKSVSKDIDKKESISKGGKGSVKSDKRKSVKSLTNDIYKDFTDLLFVYTNPNEIMEHETGFLPVTKAALSKRLVSVQNLYKELVGIDLSKGQDVAVVISNYEKHVKRYLQEFKDYNIQCEEVWLTQIQDFLQEIIVLRFQINDLIDSEISEIHEKRLKKLNVIQEEYKSQWKLLHDNNMIKRKNIELSLKPIVGAPANKNFLASLNQKAGSTNCDAVKNYIDCLNKFKESLRNELADYEKTFQERQIYYQELIDKCFTPDLWKNLMNNLILLKEPKLKEDDGSSDSVDNENQDKKFMHEDIILYMAHLVSRIQEKMLQLGVKRREMRMDPTKILMAAEFRVKPYPIETVINEVKKMYTDQLLRLAEEAVAKNEECLKDAKAWVTNWCKNVQKVRKIYIHTS